MADFLGIKKNNTTYDVKDTTARSSISTIEGKIPSSASASNKMATANDVSGVLSIVAEEFDPLVTYAVGDYCINAGVLYKCTTGHTGAWDASDFTSTIVTDELGGGSGGSSVSVSHTGTASSTGVRKQIITVDNVDYDVDGSAYMEQSVTLSTSASTTITFTNAIIADGKMLTFASSQWDLVPDDMTTATGTCTVELPKVDSAVTIGCRLYVR